MIIATCEERSRAHVAVQRMRNHGEYRQRCMICGIDYRKVLQMVGHHWRGYAYPEDVWWICASCHGRLRWYGIDHDGSHTLAEARWLMEGIGPRSIPAVLRQVSLTILEAAAILRVHHATIRRMIKRGELPAQKVGKVYRIPRAEVERYLHVQAVIG